MDLYVLKQFFQKEKQRIKEYRFLLKPTLILSAIYLLAMSAILRANFYYYDDIQRACWGWPEWGFSRHLSNILSKFLHAEAYLSDISPLPQLLAILIISFASVIAVYLITEEKRFSFWHFVAAIPIGLSPYFLECLSYKYDSPYMALSVLFSVVPLLLCKGNQIVYFLSIVLCTIGMCTSYQASAGIFPMLVVVMGIRNWIRGEKTGLTLRFYGISAAGYLVGLLLFRKLFMYQLIAYASTEMVPLSELIPSAIFTYKRYIVHFLEGFKPEWLVVSFLICVSFLWRAVSGSKHNKVLTLVLVSVAMVVMFLLSFGVYPFLEEAIFYPRAMYGIGCFIAFQGIFASTETSKGYGSKILCLMLGWAFFVFAFTYGNALNVQAEYTDFRNTEVIDDLALCSELEGGEEVTLQITGSIGYAPAVESMISDFPMIERLIPVTLKGDGWWGEFGLRYYYDLPKFQFADTYDPPEGDFTMVAENYYHTIWEKENYIWIDLH